MSGRHLDARARLRAFEFKPAHLPEIPLSLTTVPEVEGMDRLYDEEESYRLFRKAG